MSLKLFGFRQRTARLCLSLLVTGGLFDWLIWHLWSESGGSLWWMFQPSRNESICHLVFFLLCQIATAHFLWRRSWFPASLFCSLGVIVQSFSLVEYYRCNVGGFCDALTGAENMPLVLAVLAFELSRWVLRKSHENSWARHHPVAFVFGLIGLNELIIAVSAGYAPRLLVPYLIPIVLTILFSFLPRSARETAVPA